MTDLIYWQGLIAEAMSAVPPIVIKAEIHDRGIGTRSRPQRFSCDDGHDYFVKFRQNLHGGGRGIFAEQIVGSLGALLGAPVPIVRLVAIDEDMIEAVRGDDDVVLDFEPRAGIHHGSRSIGGVRDGRKDELDGRYLEENRERLAALEVLFAWIPHSGDRQFLYRNAPPHEIWSIDHTTCLPNGVMWSIDQLEAAKGVLGRDRVLASAGGLVGDRADPVRLLRGITDEQIATAVAAPPPDWAVSLEERSALASYLGSRREPIADACSGKEGE